MGKYAQFVMGPAGSGKSTYCSAVQQHCAAKGRTVHVINLDPAAEIFTYDPSWDVRDLVTLDDVMETKHLGPNGGLVYCLEYVLEHELEWVEEELGQYDDDYLLVDCPGQIELFTHYNVMKRFVDVFARY